MTEPARFKYKRAFLAFMTILLIFLIVTDMVIVSNQRKQLISEARNHMQSELDLIETFIREPLLKHDYAKVEQFLTRWAEEHNEVIEVRAVMPNNFVLAEYTRGTQSRYVHALQKQVRFGERDLISLKVVKDFSGIEGILGRLRLELTAFSFFITVLLGILLWRTVRIMALKPLESEITLRAQAEEMLQKAKDQLEARVQERTEELRGTNKSLLVEIAERERAEERLREAVRNTQDEKAKLDAVIAAIGDGISIQGTDYKVLYQNEIHKKMIGEHVGEYCYKAYEKNDNICEGCPVHMTFKDGKIHTTERSVSMPDKMLHFEITASPLRDASGEIIAGIEAARDITERKKAEEALRLSEEKFSKAFHSSQTFNSITTLIEGRFLDVNDSFLNASGYRREEIIGHTSLEYNMWADPVDRDKMLSQLQVQGFVKNMEFLFRIKTGEILTVLFSAEKINIGNEQCIFSVMLDITERNKLENQLLQSQKMEAVGQLAGGIAHDFNNIITAIFSYGYLLQSKLRSDDSASDHINKILSLSDRAAQITRGLLTFSRKQHLEVVPVNLNEILNNIEKLLINFIPEDIELTTILPDRDLIIIADRNQIEQVVLNLATNARDAMPNGGKLIIETSRAEINGSFIKTHGFGRPGRYALLTISDTGMGMDAETRQKIFEPFFTTKEVGKGTGLGLSVVYGIIKQHNGFINLYSEPGRGSTFRIYFPEIKASVEREKEKEPLQRIGKSATILVAEDEQAVRGPVKEILEEYGYKVIEAADGQDAVEKFIQYKDEIQLLLFDVVMPKMNGKEAYEEIKRISPEIKVIFTSGYTADVILKKKVLEEDVIFILKPIVPDKLLSVIREVIEGER